MKGGAVSYRDVREWIQKVDEIGELRVVEGADWNLEIGACRFWHRNTKTTRPPCCFDRIKGYPAGFRILVGFFESLGRSALTTNLPIDISREGFIQACRERLVTSPSIPPLTGSSGPILQNVYKDDDIDLFKFPVPLWHKRDGGRYIGTGHVVTTRDPDDGRVNVGCYRVMVHDHNTLGMNISPGKHGRMHRQKYFDSGKPCPVVACFGVDPLHLIATRPEPYGKCDFGRNQGSNHLDRRSPAYAGMGKPVYSPSPSRPRCCRTRERKKDRSANGQAIYASGEKTEPVVKVHRLYHRDDPIITASPEYRPTPRAEHCYELLRAAYIRDQIEKAGVPDVREVLLVTSVGPDCRLD